MEAIGPTEFSAVLVASTDDVTWTATGGTLSNPTGLHVIYTPPAGSATAMLTATAGELTATVQISSRPSQLTDRTIPGLTAPVTVQYDAQEVPHIECATAADCLAVQGYIQARDRWFPMDFLRHVARGRLAELIGPDGLAQDVQLRTIFTARNGERLETELVKVLDADPATKALLAAFVGGINAYLAELAATPGARLPGEYAQLPFQITPADIEPWTLEDTLAIGRLNQFQLSSTLNEELANAQFAAVYGPGGTRTDLGKLNAWIRAAAPETERGHTVSPGPSPGVAATAAPAAGRLPSIDLSSWRGVLNQAAAKLAALPLKPADGSTGSNNWVVAGAKSATGFAMVANDPHLSLQYPPLFHLAAMTSANPADNLDLAGGSFPGVAGALVGRGKNVGWGVTVVGYDVTDVYLEQFAPQGNCPSAAPCVLFNSAPVSTIVAPQTYLVRVGPGPTGLVPSTALPLSTPTPPAVLVIPHHGPVIQAPDAAGRALSVRWTGHEGNTRDIQAFYGLNVAKDVDDAIAALRNFAVGAQNFVLADDQGNIAYDPHALVPVRNFADARVTAPESLIPPWFPLPGDGSAEWGDGVNDCAAVVPAIVPECWIADDQLPQGKNPAKGYFFTANADPIGVSDDNNPLAHPPYLSFDWSDSSGFRATRIEQRIEQALAANGGTGKVSLADMESIQADHVSRLGMAFAPFIDALPASGAPAELAAAKAVLAQWGANGFDCPTGLAGIDPRLSPSVTDTTVLQNSSGCFLFHAFVRALASNVFTDDLAVAGQGVNGLSAVKAMLFMLGLDPQDPATAAATAFCSDVDASGATVATHTCSEQVATALAQAFGTLSRLVGPDPNSWLWGRVHTMTPVSLLPLVTTGYQPGPYARPGGAFTVDVANPSLTGGGLDFAYGASGNVRHISLMDPASPRVRMQLPGPERDGPAVTRGPDLLGQWVRNVYFDYAFGSQIDGAAVSTQTFQAP